MVLGIKEKNTAMVLSVFHSAITIQVTSFSESKMAKEHKYSKTEIDTLEAIKMANSKEKVNIFIFRYIYMVELF